VPLAHHSPAKLPSLHYGLSLLFALLLIPVLRSQNLPFKFDWITLSVAYWLILSAQSIFVAVLLSLIGLRRDQVLSPFLDRYRDTPIRIFPTAVFFIVLLFLTTWLKAVVLTVDAIAVLELVQRNKSHLRQSFLAILAPAAYFFFGFLMVLAYNSAIVSARFNFATDPTLLAIDRWLLFGHSVSDLAHWAVQTFPLIFFRALEFIYFGMFPQIGAAILIVALCDSKAAALRFVGTILTAYYLALVLFYIWPAQGPYYLCPQHFSRFPASLQAYSIQKALITHALARWHHEPLARISTDYFIALPCMHIAQPLIVMCFLRRWRRIVIALAAYDVLLLAAIVFLEWHYVIDILAGVLVAAAAIVITGSVSFGRRPIPSAAALADRPE
jgi:hypothetical protein